MLEEILKTLRNNIFYKDKLIYISEYEQKNIKIFEQMFNNEDKINLLITPDKEIVEILLLVVLGIKLYTKNLNNKDGDILQDLSVGDRVVYEGKKAEYLGLEELYGGKKIKLKYKESKFKGMTMEGANNYIRVQDSYKLSIYRGDSKNLNTMSDKKSNKRNGKYILADMLGIKLEELSHAINEQMVIVYPSKNKLEDLLMNIKIRVKNKKYYFTEIFPSKYYNSIDNGIDFKGNKLKLKEIFLFTSNLDVATDVVQEYEETRNLLLLGQDIYVNEINGSLEFLLKIGKIKKIYIFNTFNKVNQLDQLLESGFDIKLNAWTKMAFLKEIDKTYMPQICFKNKKIDLFLNRKVENKLINQCINISENLLKLKIDLREVSMEEFYCDNKEKFLIISYGLLKIFEKTIVTIKEYDEFIMNNNLNNCMVQVLIEKLIGIVKENENYENTSETLKNIVQLIKDLYELMYYKNPKFHCLKNINLRYGDLIICNNSIEESILKKYEFIKNKYIRVDCIKNHKLCSDFKKVIFTGVYDNKNIDQVYCFDGLNVVNLIYPSEVSKYNRKVNKYNRLFNLIEENNSLSTSNSILPLLNIQVDYNKFFKKETMDNNINEEIIEKSEKEIEKNIYVYTGNDNYKAALEYDLNLEDLLNIDINKNLDGLSFQYDTSGQVKKKIKFKDGKYAFLTSFYKSKCIVSNNITIKSINSLEIGDKLIFTYDRARYEITKLFYKIMSSDKFKNRYHKHYYNMNYWKKILKAYIDRCFGDYSLVVLELSFYGVNRTEQAIKSWVLDENIIGPTEKEIYSVLGKITNDKYLIEHWEEIYKSCNLIRSLKTKLKSNFNYMVIKSVINERSEGIFENLVYDVLGDLKQYADIEEIDQIEEASIKMPINRTNCILEKKMVYQLLK